MTNLRNGTQYLHTDTKVLLLCLCLRFIYDIDLIAYKTLSLLKYYCVLDKNHNRTQIFCNLTEISHELGKVTRQTDIHPSTIGGAIHGILIVSVVKFGRLYTHLGTRLGTCYKQKAESVITCTARPFELCQHKTHLAKKVKLSLELKKSD